MFYLIILDSNSLNSADDRWTINKLINRETVRMRSLMYVCIIICTIIIISAVNTRVLQGTYIIYINIYSDNKTQDPE